MLRILMAVTFAVAACGDSREERRCDPAERQGVYKLDTREVVGTCGPLDDIVGIAGALPPGCEVTTGQRICASTYDVTMVRQ